MLRFPSSVLLAVLAAASSVVGQESCQTIAEIACGTEGFDILCTAVGAADLANTLSYDTFTVFAPTNAAFAKALDVLGLSSLEDIPLDVLTDVLLYHAVDDVLFAEDLECSEPIEMVNGEETTTICDGEDVFQVGAGNVEIEPQIVATNIEACNGVVHVIDAVILPEYLAPEPECESIAEIACGADDFDVLCEAVKTAGLADALAGGLWTVFAPTDEAFENLLGDDPIGAVKSLPVDDLEALLLFHVVADDDVYFDELGCGCDLKMATGEYTWTYCTKKGKKFQSGWGNYDIDIYPKIIVEDVKACNGVIHVVSEVLLPKGF